MVPPSALVRTLTAALLLLGAWAPARAQEPEIFVQLGYKTDSDFNGGRKLVFSPDGSLLASVTGDSNIRVWATETGRELATLTGHAGAVKSLAFLPDSRRLVSGGEDRTVKLWDLETGRLVRTFWGHQEEVRALAASPDGALLASIENKALRLWNLETGGLAAVVPAPADPGGASGHVRPLRSVACSPDSAKVLMANLSGELFVVGVQERRIVATLRGADTGVYSMQDFLGTEPDGKLTLGGASALIHLDLARLAVVAQKFPLFMYMEHLSANGDLSVGRTLGDQTLHVFDAAGKERSAIVLRDNVVQTAYSPVRSQVAVSALGDHLDLYDLATGKVVKDFGAPIAQTRGSSFSPDGRHLSLNVHVDLVAGRPGSADTWVQRWDLGQAALVKFYNFTEFPMPPAGLFDAREPEAQKRHLEMFREHQRFTSASDYYSPYDEASRCFYVVSADPPSAFEGTTYVTIQRVDATDANDFTARNSANRSRWKTVHRFKAHAQNITTFAVTYAHGLIATGSEDKTINLFSYRDRTLLRTLRGHLGPITHLTFSPDGTRLASESSDLTTRLWDVASGRELARFMRFSDGEWIIITPQGYYNASANGDQHLNVRSGTGVFGIDNYRETFFRPDLVKTVLAGGTLEGYLTLAEVKPAPRISIVQTPSVATAQDFKVTLKLEERGGGLGDVRLFLNGSAVLLDTGRDGNQGGARAVKITHREEPGVTYRTYQVKLAAGVNTLRAAAFNADNSMQGNGATHQVAATFTSSGPRTLHALVIGIQEFRNPRLRLKYSVADADLFAQTLRNGASGLFSQVRITTLTTREATTRGGIVKALRTFQAINPDDVFILYLASHGTVDEGEYYLITSNVGALSTQRLKDDALPQGLLRELVANIPATKKLIVVDTCNAGQLGQAMQTSLLTRGMSEETAMKVLSRAVGSTILSASTSVQEALEGYQGHGLFTWVLTQGMLGKADKGRTGVVQTMELAAYVEVEVPELAERIFRRAQFPTASISGHGFPVGTVK